MEVREQLERVLRHHLTKGRDEQFYKMCCTDEFCTKRRIIVKCAKRWTVRKYSREAMDELKKNRATFILVTPNGVILRGKHKSIWDGIESKGQMFNMCKGERFHKKPQNGGSSLPYQRGLSGGATRREDAEANRVSTWSICITK